MKEREEFNIPLPSNALPKITFFKKKKFLENHLRVCSLVPCLVNQFESQNVLTFKKNVRLMGDLSFAIYFDFPTTSGRESYSFFDEASVYPVSNAFVVAFHPELDLERIPVVRSFNQTFDSLHDVGYLYEEMLFYFNFITASQLSDCAKDVYEKNKKYS